MNNINNKDIYNLFSEGFQPGFYKRIGEGYMLNLYIGKNEKGCYAFEYKGNFIPTRIFGSEVISVEQFADENCYTLCFSLEKEELLERFCTFCFDLLDSTNGITDHIEGYRAIYNRYISWRKLFKSNNGNLTEPEIMGLIGELLFLKNEMIPVYGEAKSIESWMGPERTHKDFSINDTWFEIKSVNSNKDSIRISSIEQLDSDTVGCLAVYKLEKMGPTFNGIKLNALVNELITMIKNDFYKDLFFSKLELYGYDGSSDYDNNTFSQSSFAKYTVDKQFPRVTRDMLPISIIKIQYDIILSDIENFKYSMNYGDR